MIVLDTNVVSEVFRPHPDARVVAWMENLTGDVAITAVTPAELLAGVRRLSDGRRKSALGARIDAALRPFRETRAVLAFDVEAADHYADVLVARERAGMPISTADARSPRSAGPTVPPVRPGNIKDLARTGVELVDPWTR